MKAQIKDLQASLTLPFASPTIRQIVETSIQVYQTELTTINKNINQTEDSIFKSARETKDFARTY